MTKPVGNQPPSILLVHPSPDLYGSDRVFDHTVQAAVATGAAVHVVLPEPGPLSAYLRRHGASVHYIASPVLRKSVLKPTGAVQFGKDVLTSTRAGLALLRQTQADPVYVNTLTMAWWLVLGRLAGRTVVNHVHEAEHRLPRVVRAALSAPVNVAHTVIVNSHTTARALTAGAKKAAHSAVMVVNPITSAQCTPPSVKPPVSLHIGYVGRLSERKGVHVAVAAVKELHRQGVDATLHIVGAVYPGYEWYEKRLRDQIDSLGVQGSVVFHGFHANPAAVVEQCQMMVVPSTGDESFGNTVVEAILAGKPVSVAAHSGLLEAGKDYVTVGWHVPGDAKSLAESLQSLLHDWAECVAAWPGDRDRAHARHDPVRYQRALRTALGFPPAGDVAPELPLPVPKVVVAVLTYRRNDVLPTLLPRLTHQVREVAESARVVVVDNNLEPLARSVAEPLLGDEGWYVHHPTPGIASARNRALDEAEAYGADAIVFIDDDELPSPGWLRRLVHRFHLDRPAGVVGPVVPQFKARPPQWIEDSGVFVTARRATGSSVPMAATNNVLLDMRVLAKAKLSFAEKFSFSGGSDSRLTWQLVRDGHQLVWDDEAQVVDHIPTSRMTMTWLAKRALRLGNSRPRVELDMVRHDAVATVKVKGKYLCHGVARIVAGPALVVLGTVRSEVGQQVRGVRTMMRGVGMVWGALGVPIHEYRRAKARIPVPRRAGSSQTPASGSAR